MGYVVIFLYKKAPLYEKIMYFINMMISDSVHPDSIKQQLDGSIIPTMCCRRLMPNVVLSDDSLIMLIWPNNRIGYNV